MAEIKQIATRIAPVTVYREGTSVWEEQFPVVVYADGEMALAGETALKVEERQKHYLNLAERGELPEPTARVERAAEAPPSGPPRVIGTRMKPVPVYEEGDRLWEEEFPATVYDDGYFGFDPAQVHHIEERRAHYLGACRPGVTSPNRPVTCAPEPTGAEGALRHRDLARSPSPSTRRATDSGRRSSPYVVYDDGEIGLEDAIIREWEVAPPVLP